MEDAVLLLPTFTDIRQTASLKNGFLERDNSDVFFVPKI